jgi:hypothetical protein
VGLTSAEQSDEEDVIGVSSCEVLFDASGDTIFTKLVDEVRRRSGTPNSVGHSSLSMLFEFLDCIKPDDRDLRLRDGFRISEDERIEDSLSA